MLTDTQRITCTQKVISADCLPELLRRLAQVTALMQRRDETILSLTFQQHPQQDDLAPTWRATILSQ